MSTRTIIEINHDYLSSGQYRDTEARLIALLYGLRSCNWQETRHAHEPAFRVLGQRHHSDPEWAPNMERALRSVESATFAGKESSAYIAGWREAVATLREITGRMT